MKTDRTPTHRLSTHWVRATFRVALIPAVLIGLWFGAAAAAAPAPPEPPMEGVPLLDEPITPIPLHLELDAERVRLGRALFHDPQLSRDGSVRCASCHDLATGGTDGQPRSIGVDGLRGDMNAPTVLNSGFNFKQFWNGRAASLEEQLDGPVHNPQEMDSDWPTIVARLAGTPRYRTAFAALYTDGITAPNIKNAIATFERSLYTPNAPFDRFLRGDADALSADEKAGYQLFKTYGCVSCHQGMGVGGNMFQALGVMSDYFEDRGGLTSADLGRFNVTSDERDRYVFKVPSLRNVALTAPYFHDGSVETLEEAVSLMGTYQLGRRLSARDVDHVVKFLRTLTGVPPEYQ